MTILPGLWVVLLAALLALALRRWFDPVPLRCWLVWGLVMAPLFGAALFGGRVMLPLGYLTRVPPFSGLAEGLPPGNLLQGDLVLQITPWMMRVREAYLAGEWPLWNPLAGAGEPLLANPQSQAFQPLVWLALPFPVALAVGVVVALRMLLPLVFSYLLFRRQGLSEAVSLGSSLAFGLSGFLQLFLGWPLAGSATFLPVLLYALVLTGQRGARRDRLLLALAVAALLLVGHPETGLHVLALAGIWGLSLLRARPAGRRLALAGSWAVAGAVGCALAAPVVLPAAAYLPQSVRASLLEARRDRLAAEIPADEAPAPGARERGIVPRLLPVAAPNVFGNNRFGAYWGERNVNEDAAGFTGTAALFAFLLALLPLNGGRRFPQERLALGTALVCLVVLARPPGLPELLDALPVLRQSLSFHSRIALLFNFCVAFAAGCTWERWQRGEVRTRRVVPLALVLAAGIAWAYLAHPGPALSNLRYGTLALQLGTLTVAALLLSRAGRSRAALLLVVAVELLVIHGPANPTAPAALFYPRTPSIAFLEERLDPWHRVAGLGPALRPNFASVYGLADPRSSNPIKPAPYVEAIRRINRFPGRPTDGFTSPGDPLYGLLGVRFVMTAPRVRLPRPLRLVDRRPGALPRLFLPASAAPCGAGWASCTEKIGDFAETAAVRPPGMAWSAVDPRGSSLALGELRPAWMRARAFLAEPRLLAGSVYQDGGWRLLIDGRPQPTILANGPFVAAWLPAGEVSVDLLYRPRGFLLGMVLAALGLAAGVASWVPPPGRQTAPRSQTRIEPSE
jgi:hypothetical protein